MISRTQALAASAALLTTSILNGCVVNPVTGEKQVSLISTQQELQLGQQHYSANQQQQGGQYTIDPALQDYVSAVGHKLARVSDQPQLPYEFVVLNNSIPNAWALPGGKIAVNRGLLILLDDEAELAAVLSHEIVHAAARHSATAMSQQQLLGAGLAIVGAATQNTGYSDLIASGSQLGGSAYIARYSRGNELESDQYGMKYMAAAGYDLQGAVRLQRKFVELSKDRQTGGLEALFASHPPSQSRVSANIKHSESLPKGGVTHRAVYQKAIAQLKRDASAYDNYDEAVAAANNKKFDSALTLVRKAQKQQPKEAAFFTLEGDLLGETKQFKNAYKAYDHAIQKNPSLFSNWLKRGLINLQLKDYVAAERDLTRSLRFLDTAYAHYYLGETYEKQGNQQSAYKHYQTAAGAGGEIGTMAQGRIKAITDKG
ncbi:M48 family metalloprotease [Microbulbifer sp. OS29]|uniref:M48 family metalloprotease n=1 Tax=Microbulbifer okhotskensis TaxID=2926617 RepID=A0A9X2ENG5_9GAMM|nr:M48 family metalloprotease [Microbulbifer okhotskensis]MCO1332828.1 M48 family metalloprotease [Microbulbifer okhotskensis]